MQLEHVRSEIALLHVSSCPLPSGPRGAQGDQTHAEEDAQPDGQRRLLPVEVAQRYG